MYKKIFLEINNLFLYYIYYINVNTFYFRYVISYQIFLNFDV